MRKEIIKAKTKKTELSPAKKVAIARHGKRPKIEEYIEALFDDFFYQRGDYIGKEDKSIVGGIGLFHGRPVTVIGHKKGENLKDNVECNFGMSGPEGYRKALRIMKQAEKFNRPIITFIDTPGAYPGIEAEENGQSIAIANNLAAMSTLQVPVIAVITGEGSSGGALAIGVANKVFMLENSVYSILSPEGFATILWKDKKRSDEAAEVMKLTAEDLLEFGVIDGIIEEPDGGAHEDREQLFTMLDRILKMELEKLRGYSREDIAKERYEKFRNIDKKFIFGA